MANLIDIFSLALARYDLGTMSIYASNGIGETINGSATSLWAVVIGEAATVNSPIPLDMTLEIGTII
jgi:hypothetical protein